MWTNLLGTTTTPPSKLNNPFSRDKVDTVSTYCYRDYKGNPVFTGSITFKSGNTVGEQKFKEANFDTLVLEMKSFIDSL